MSKQHARVKNTVKWEDDIQDQQINTNGFIGEFLEDSSKSSNMKNKILTITYGIQSIKFIQILV
jgi:hypothetical protein